MHKDENARLKRMVADQALDIETLSGTTRRSRSVPAARGQVWRSEPPPRRHPNAALTLGVRHVHDATPYMLSQVMSGRNRASKRGQRPSATAGGVPDSNDWSASRSASTDGQPIDMPAWEP